MTLAPSTSTTPRTVAPPSGTSRLLVAADAGLAAHQAAFGPVPHGVDVAALVEAAGLTGRGGAGFPSARKLRGVAERGAARGGAVVVANGSEGEPASAKDRTLLTRSPHLVLDGLALAAGAVGARRAVLVTARADVADRVRAAAARRRDPVPVEVQLVVDRFVSGEESAVVNRLNGRPGVPSDRMVRVFEKGVSGRPTLVHNVETLAQLALLARFGVDWYRSVGTHDQPGTYLATVSGHVARPGVYEVAYGTALGDLVRSAGGPAPYPQAVLVGGYHGAWVPGADVGSTRLSRTGLAPYAAAVGAGVTHVLGHDRCGLVQSARIASYLASQVAGQCGPCVNGMPRMASMLERLARSERDPRLVGEVERMAGLVTGRGACSHPDGTVRFVRSSLGVFADEVAVHLGGGCSV